MQCHWMWMWKHVPQCLIIEYEYVFTFTQHIKASEIDTTYNILCHYIWLIASYNISVSFQELLMSWMITYILILYATWASQHTIIHPTQHFISTYPALWARGPAGFYSRQLLYITTTFLRTLLSQRPMESAWCPRSDFRVVLKFCIIKSSCSQIYTQGGAYYYSRLQLYSAVKSYPVVVKLVATLPDYYKHIKSHNMQRNWWWLCYRHNNYNVRILAHNAAFMVYVVMMLLWLPIGSHTNFENKGSSARPGITTWIV